MKFSLKWLGDFIPVKDFLKDPYVLSKALTKSGLEVDDVEDQRMLYEGIVIAKIKSIKKHPGADRLTVCEVFDGKKTYQVVCGAKNHKEGDLVVLTKVGVKLPDFTIKKSKIRGVESEGMLASKSELGFEDSEEKGIWILKEGKVGESFSQALGLDDVILDVATPPNRPDVLSHKGLAREVALLFNLPFKNRKISLSLDKKLIAKKEISVQVENEDFCSRYCGRVIKDVKIKSSPPWLKKRLESLSLKSINNVVDITNFILWDQGQPLHAFDFDKIKKIEVGFLKKEKSFKALDEESYQISKTDLVIKEGDRVLALAGVIGGQDSAISDQTKNIFLESASFSKEKVRRSSRSLGLETDSSYRFSRGIDEKESLEAMNMACSFIKEEAGGRISYDFLDEKKKEEKLGSIEISLEEISSRLGYEISSKDFVKEIKKSGSEIKEKKGKFFITPPSYRKDLLIKEDLIEEFARLRGYDEIPETLPFCKPQTSKPSFERIRSLTQFLSARGFLQAIRHSFSDPVFYKEFLKEQFFLEDALGKSHNKETFFVDNPIRPELSFMRPLLSPSAVSTVIYNMRRNNKFGQMFEISPVFWKEKKEYKEDLHLSLIRFGEDIDIWRDKKTPPVFHLKSDLEALLDHFQLKYTFKQAKIPFLNPGALILTVRGEDVGFLGHLHLGLRKKYKIPMDVAIFEMKFDKDTKSSLKYKPFSSLPLVEKDLSFLVPSSVSAETVRSEIKKCLGGVCEKVEIFDVFHEKEERSLSFRIHFKASDKSFTDDELQGFLNKAISQVKDKFSIHLKQEKTL